MSLIAAGMLLASGTVPNHIDLWVINVTDNAELATFIDKSTVEAKPGGWTAFWYENVLNGTRLKDIKSARASARANCATRTLAVDTMLAYGPDGRLMQEVSPGPAQHVVQTGTIDEKILAFICGNAQGATQLPLGSITVKVADGYYARRPANMAGAPPGPGSAAVAATPGGDDTRLKKFLDSKGGYRNRLGGYYDPVAGTYTDEKGGILDNWRGYAYKDRSYKSALGDYYDAPQKTIHLSNGDVVKKPEANSDADVISALRGEVEDNHAYDKDYIRKNMMQSVAEEHPARSVR